MPALAREALTFSRRVPLELHGWKHRFWRATLRTIKSSDSWKAFRRSQLRWLEQSRLERCPVNKMPAIGPLPVEEIGADPCPSLLMGTQVLWLSRASGFRISDIANSVEANPFFSQEARTIRRSSRRDSKIPQARPAGFLCFRLIKVRRPQSS